METPTSEETEFSLLSAKIRLERVAFRIFEQLMHLTDPRMAALSAFHRARIFLAISEEVSKNEVKCGGSPAKVGSLNEAVDQNLTGQLPTTDIRDHGPAERVAALKKMAADPQAHGLSDEDARLVREVVQLCESRAGTQPGSDQVGVDGVQW